jgi:3-oxoacyl-[acyl-carrier-protein] synthase II
MHRVVVTGIGVVSPIGTGVDAFWKGVLEGRIGVRSITRFDASTFGSRIAAEVDDFRPDEFMEQRRVRRTDRFAQFAVSAARMAIDDARFSIDGNGADVGAFIGSALGGLAYAEEQHRQFTERGIEAVKPLLAMSVFGGASTTNVALEFGLHGPTVANGNSCASGAVAIGDAFRAVARGEARAAFAGGAEAPLAPLTFGAFTVIRAMSVRNDDPARASRPFDRDRDGFVMAEGSAILFLERLDDAVARGARIYGEIAGYGTTNDAYHMTAPRPDGACMARAMTSAMVEAGIVPSDVGLFYAHGSATPLNDRTETLALRTVLGDAAGKVPVTATKGQHGHALGATGAWEAAISLLALADGRVPRVVNLDHPDPDCRLAFVRETTVLRPDVVLSNSSGFGGINAALVFRRVDARG